MADELFQQPFDRSRRAAISFSVVSWSVWRTLRRK